MQCVSSGIWERGLSQSCSLRILFRFACTHKIALSSDIKVVFSTKSPLDLCDGGHFQRHVVTD